MNGKLKYILQKTMTIILTVVTVGASLCACAVKPVETSTKYLVGFIYSSGDDWGMSPGVECRVRYDKSVDAIFEWYDGNELVSKTLNFKLDDARFSNIEKVTDPQEIYRLRPQCNERVLDGSDSWLFVYGPDDAVLKRCGGYCPENERFREIENTLYKNVPEKLIEVYSQYEEVYSGAYSYEEEYLEKQFNVIFENMYSQYVSE